MKEREELFERSFIAYPITESPLLKLIKEINPHKKFVHMTMLFMGDLDEEKLEEIKSLIASNLDNFAGSILKPSKLDILRGTRLIVKIEDTEQLKSGRVLLEQNLSEFAGFNMPHLPHVSVQKIPDDRARAAKLLSMKNKELEVEAFIPKSVGVYYKIDGATALLFSKKLNGAGS